MHAAAMQAIRANQKTRIPAVQEQQRGNKRNQDWARRSKATEGPICPASKP